MPIFTSKGKETKGFDITQQTPKFFTQSSKTGKVFELIINGFFSANYWTANFVSNNIITVLNNLASKVGFDARFISISTMSIDYRKISDRIWESATIASTNIIQVVERFKVNFETATFSSVNSIIAILGDILRISLVNRILSTNTISATLVARKYYMVSDWDSNLLSDLDSLTLQDLDYQIV